MVVDLDEETSNQIFAKLEDWEHQLKHADFDFERLELWPGLQT